MLLSSPGQAVSVGVVGGQRGVGELLHPPQRRTRVAQQRLGGLRRARRVREIIAVHGATVPARRTRGQTPRGVTRPAPPPPGRSVGARRAAARCPPSDHRGARRTARVPNPDSGRSPPGETNSDRPARPGQGAPGRPHRSRVDRADPRRQRGVGRCTGGASGLGVQPDLEGRTWPSPGPRTAASPRRRAGGRRRTGSGSPARLPGEILRRLAQDVPLGGQPSAPRAIAEAVVGGVTLDAPDALILGDHHGGYAWPAAPDP